MILIIKTEGELDLTKLLADGSFTLYLPWQLLQSVYDSMSVSWALSRLCFFRFTPKITPRGEEESPLPIDYRGDGENVKGARDSEEATCLK